MSKRGDRFADRFGNEDDLIEVEGAYGGAGDDEDEEMDRNRQGNGEIVLSSDDEGEAPAKRKKDDDDIALVTVKQKKTSMLARPRADQDPNTFVPNEESRANAPEVEKIVSGDELGIKAIERKGYIKEYIDPSEGLGILFSNECGLVLFHLDMGWIDGKPANPGKNSLRSAVQGEMQPGTNVTFLDSVHEGPEYKVVSGEKFMRQAAALWTGNRPKLLLRAVNKDEHLSAMERHRKDFLVHVRGESFRQVDLVRQKGRITGYLTERIGLVEFRFEPEGQLHLAMFCPKDGFIYKKQANKFGVPIWTALPAGLNVYFDARKIEPTHRGVGYQVIAIFAGTWPQVPHPTLLPGGPGSVCDIYEFSGDSKKNTFYYLNLKMAESQDDDWNEFCAQSDRRGVALMEVGDVVEDAESFYRWQKRFAPFNVQQRQHTGYKKHHDKTNYHEFKREAPKKAIFKTRIKQEADGPVAVKVEQGKDGELRYRIKSEKVPDRDWSAADY